MHLPLAYFGNTRYWSEAIQAGNLTLREKDTFQRRSQYNRTRIATANGTQLLSIPLKGSRNQKVLISETEISYAEDWQKQHFQSIRSAYGSAPFWLEYEPDLAKLYEDQCERLWDWDLKILNWVNKQLGCPIEISTLTEVPIVHLNISMESDENLPAYVQIFRERHGWISNLSILDLLMCTGPQALQYLHPG